jgi:hypothetical protein
VAPPEHASLAGESQLGPRIEPAPLHDGIDGPERFQASQDESSFAVSPSGATGNQAMVGTPNGIDMPNGKGYGAAISDGDHFGAAVVRGSYTNSAPFNDANVDNADLGGPSTSAFKTDSHPLAPDGLLSDARITPDWMSQVNEVPMPVAGLTIGNYASLMPSLGNFGRPTGYSFEIVVFDASAGFDFSAPGMVFGHPMDEAGQPFGGDAEQRLVSQSGISALNFDGLGRAAQVSSSQIFGSQGASAKDRTSPAAPLSLPVIEMPTVSQSDTGNISHNQPALAIVPSAGFDHLTAPSPTLLSTDPAIDRSAAGRSAGSDAQSPANHLGRPITVSRSGRVPAEAADADAWEATEYQVLTASFESPRVALLQGLQLNMRAVDQAIAALVSEVEDLSGGWATWATWWEETGVPSWAALVTVAAACGAGNYMWRTRSGRMALDASEEESATWLFTQLQTPLVP